MGCLLARGLPATKPVKNRVRFSVSPNQLFSLALWGLLLTKVHFDLFGYQGLLQIGAFNLVPTDIALLMCLPALLHSVRFAQARRLPTVLAMAFALLMLIALTRGIMSNGAFNATFAVRAHVLYIVSFLIVALAPLTVERSRRIVMTFIHVAWILIAIALLRYGLSYQDRVLSSEGGILLGQSALMAFGLALTMESTSHSKRKWTLTAMFFLIILLSTGQRSATAAGLGGVAVMLFVSPTKYRAYFQAGILLFLVCLLVIFAAAVSDLGVQGTIKYLPEFMQQPFSVRSTLDWRLEQTKAALHHFQALSSISQLFGMPLGTHFGYSLGGVFGHGHYRIHYSIHNHYVKTLMDFGVAGITLFTVIVLYGARRQFARWHTLHADPYLTPPVMLGLLISQLIYANGYWLQGIQGIILGALIATRYTSDPPSRH